MAVLCEAISVVIRADRLIEAYGDFDAFKTTVPHETLVADNELVRLGFTDQDEVKSLVRVLEARGLVSQENRVAKDFVIVHQCGGFLRRCDWAEFGYFAISDEKVAAVRMLGSKLEQLVTPGGWELEGSLTQSFIPRPSGKRVNIKNAKYSKNADGRTIAADMVTGVEVVISLIAPESSPDPEKLAKLFRRNWIGDLYEL